MSAQKDDRVRTRESGNIDYVYRPRVEEEEAESKEGVQQLYMALKPKGESVYRLLVIGGREMPDPRRSGRGKYWGSSTRYRSA